MYPNLTPHPNKPETWLRRGQDPGYDKHIDLLTGIWNETGGPISSRPLHDFLHMSWPQYQQYTEAR